MYLNETIKKYLEDLGAKLPAPGGGSASAVCGALGISLLEMVANFTVGKDKYKEVEPEIKNILNGCEELNNELKKLIDEDVQAYQKVSCAYKLPKDNEEQKKQREEEVQKVTREALEVPLQIARYCRQGLDLAQRLVDIGNINLISDVGVGAVFLEAGLKGAELNVRINLAYLKDKEFVEGKQKILNSYLESASQIKDLVWQKTLAKM